MPLPINPDPGFVVQDLPPVSASIVRSIPRSLSLKRSWIPQSHNWSAMSAAQYTVSSQWGLECGYDLVRLVYSNNSAAPYTITLVKVSPSSAVGDGHSPVNAAGANDFTMFLPVYFNNAGLDVSPQAQTTWGSGATTFTVPANGGSLNQPTRWYSDWVRVISLDRTDGGANPLLMVRTLTDALGTFRTSSQTTVLWPALANGRSLAANFKNGIDSVTIPALLVTPTLANTLTPDGVEYMARAPGFTVMGAGDSLTQGLGSTTTVHGWPYLSSMALSTPGRPISYWCQAVAGSNSNDYWANTYVGFRTCLPDVITIPVWTPNDALTQAGADTAWSRAMDLAGYAMRSGAVPVLMGPLPWLGVTTGAQELARLSARTRMLQAGANGLYVLDWENLVGTGASPNRIQPALLWTDSQHPNDAGNALMDSAVFRPVLTNILRA